jgi:class 3 adenylate cyclase
MVDTITMESTRSNTQEALWPRIARHFFTHSGHVPLTLLVLETLLSKPGYFAEPDAYVLLAAGLFQAWLTESGLLRGNWRPVLANLSGPLFYTVIEAGLEGYRFFQGWHHQAYWVFAFVFAFLHWMQSRSARVSMLLVLVENIVRAAIPLALYAIFEVQASGGQKLLLDFFKDSAHDFLAIVLLMLGTLLGFADIGLRRSLLTIHALNARLREFSEWSLGSSILARAIDDESTLALQRVERSIVFMDIRGFTAWSERQTPEAVVGMLNRYYHAAESALSSEAAERPIKLKYTADEVMAVFAEATVAAATAPRMLAAASRLLQDEGLTAGVGVHCGQVVEGVLGGEGAKAYDFIGDTVNTAQRLCDGAAAGEVLFSAEACHAAQIDPASTSPRSIAAKGKREPLAAAAMRVTGG